MEFQAVIDASQFGHGLFPFTEKTNRLLLPVLNKPILSYYIENLIKSHISSIVFICA